MAGKFRLDGQNAEKALRLLKIVASSLERHGVIFGLDGGTLLGIVRENRLLPWDNDLDLVIPGGQDVGLLRALKELAKQGYKTSKGAFKDAYGPLIIGALRICKIQDGEVCIDLIIKYHDDAYWYWQVGSKKVKKKVERCFYDRFERLEFEGMSFPIPSDIERYLTVRYGDWKTPKQDYKYTQDDGAIIRLKPIQMAPVPFDISSKEPLHALAPSLGYFGGSVLDFLKVDVGLQVTSMKLQIDSGKEAYLNLKGIEFSSKNGKIELSSHDYEIAQSSLQKNDASRGTKSLLAKKGIHSRKEMNPWWEIKFRQPVYIERIKLWNRPDGWGSRSKTLAIEIVDEKGGKHRIYDGISKENLNKSLAVFNKVSGLDIGDISVLNASSAELIRIGILKKLAAIARKESSTVSVSDWAKLLVFTHVWSDAEPSEDEWCVLAASLIAQKKIKPAGATSIKMMANCLNSRGRLQRFENELRQLASRYGLGELMLSRHGLRSADFLQIGSSKYVLLLRKIIDAMSALGYEVVIAYGTLLGAVREGRFLAHDDDVDILFKAKATNRPALEKEILEVRTALVKVGFRARDLLPKFLNMHVLGHQGATAVDLFPCWLEDGKMYMHMDSMAIRGIEPESMFPASSVVLEGEKFPAPAKPEVFLKQRYGDGWSVADPYYDWPWKLVD